MRDFYISAENNFGHGCALTQIDRTRYCSLWLRDYQQLTQRTECSQQGRILRTKLRGQFIVVRKHNNTDWNLMGRALDDKWLYNRYKWIDKMNSNRLKICISLRAQNVYLLRKINVHLYIETWNVIWLQIVKSKGNTSNNEYLVKSTSST